MVCLFNTPSRRNLVQVSLAWVIAGSVSAFAFLVAGPSSIIFGKILFFWPRNPPGQPKFVEKSDNGSCGARKGHDG